MKKISKKRAYHLLSILKDKIGHYSQNYVVELDNISASHLYMLRVSSPFGFYGSCAIKDIYDFAEDYTFGFLSVAFSSKYNCITIELN